MSQNKTTIGRAENVDFPALSLKGIPARIDTGAKTSSIWVTGTTVEDGVLTTVLFGEGSAFYTGKPVQFTDFAKTVVASSIGNAQVRYKVRFSVTLKGRKIKAWFTLADRSTQVYPVLVGRNVLLGKFVVDVKTGTALKEAERNRTKELRSRLRETKD